MTPYTVDDLSVATVYIHPECYSATSGGSALAPADLPKVLTNDNKSTIVGYSGNVIA